MLILLLSSALIRTFEIDQVTARWFWSSDAKTWINRAVAAKSDPQLAAELENVGLLYVFSPDRSR